MAAYLDGEPAYRYYNLDVLFDRLHQLGCCGCKDCLPKRMQGNRRMDGTKTVWLAVTLSDGYRIEYIAGSYDEAAWKINRAVTDRLIAKPPKP
jgi:hypothetical protein